jgi:hypothetical protein
VIEVGLNDEPALPVKIGFCDDDFPRSQSGFVGDLDDVPGYSCALPPAPVGELCRCSQAVLSTRKARSHRTFPGVARPTPRTSPYD